MVFPINMLSDILNLENSLESRCNVRVLVVDNLIAKFNSLNFFPAGQTICVIFFVLNFLLI